MVQLQDSILEHLHRYTLFNMLFDMTSETHCAQILSCSGPGVGVWLIIRPVSLTVRLYSLVFCITFHKWLGPSLNCMHPSMCAHFPSTLWVSTCYIMLMATNTLNPWCNLHHLCGHCARCWFPHGKKTIICTSFNHIQLLLSTTWHCAYQRWHSHFNRHCHYRPNTNEFISLILCNSRICCLQCSSSQGNEFLQPTPH